MVFLREKQMMARSSSRHFTTFALVLTLGSGQFVGLRHVAGADYMVHNDWGGTWHDANKSFLELNDGKMCWAGGASNVLSWTGWGAPPQKAFPDEQAIFDYYVEHWTNDGQQVESAWSWWFDGTYDLHDGSYVDRIPHPEDGHPFWVGQYSFRDYYRSSSDYGFSSLPTARQYLDTAYGVTLWIAKGITDSPTGSHVITCWGYSLDTQGNIVGVWITDSDPHNILPDRNLRHYDVSFKDSHWFLSDEYSDGGWWVYQVDALRQKEVHVDNGKVLTLTDITQPVSEPYAAFAQLHVGHSTNGTIIQTGGYTPIRDNLVLGYDAGSRGDYNLSGAGSLQVDENEYLGLMGRGYFTQTEGAHTVNQNLYLGRGPGSKGWYDLSGNSVLQVNGAEFIGYKGEGHFTHAAGTHTVGQTLYLGREAGSSGSYELFDGSLTVHDEVIGYAGEGYFTQHGGTHTIIGDLDIGVEPGSFGSYTHQGGTLSVGGATTLGPGGHFRLAGTIQSSGGVVNAGSFEWSSGSISGTGGVTNTGELTVVDGGEKRIVSSRLTNSGTITQTGGESIMFGGSGTNPAILENQTTGLYDLQGDGGFEKLPYPQIGIIDNAGTFRKSGGTGTSWVGNSIAFNNTGTVEVTSGTLAFAGGYNQTAGATMLNGGTITSTTPMNIYGGTIEGTGIIDADILNHGGLVSPGLSPGMLTIDGDYTQGSEATLLLEMAGLGLGEYDIFNVTGTATLGGYLQIDFLNDFRPMFGDTFDIFTYDSCVGQFDSMYARGFPDYSFIPTYGLTGLALEIGNVPSAIPLPSSGCLAIMGILAARRWGRRHE